MSVSEKIKVFGMGRTYNVRMGVVTDDVGKVTNGLDWAKQLKFYKDDLISL